MTEAEQAELAALRELEKAVRADHRDGVIYVPDSQDPKVNRDARLFTSAPSRSPKALRDKWSTIQ